MPWYDYQCEKCGNAFEVQRAFGATGRVKCPGCGSTRTLKVFSPAMVQFKGSGFYVTDSKNGHNPAMLPAAAPPAGEANTAASGDKAAESATPAAASKPDKADKSESKKSA